MQSRNDLLISRGDYIRAQRGELILMVFWSPISQLTFERQALFVRIAAVILRDDKQFDVDLFS